MILCSCAFLVAAVGASFANEQGIVSVNWLILSYALQSIGELMISGLGLAMVAQLVPQRLMGFIMGSWFLTTAAAALIAGKVAGLTAVPSDINDAARFAGHLQPCVYADRYRHRRHRYPDDADRAEAVPHDAGHHRRRQSESAGSHRGSLIAGRLRRK